MLLLGSAAVFAGKPGRYYREDMSLTLNTGLIEDWSKCIKTLSVSSRESFAHRLVDSSDSYWQSCGSQGKVSDVIYVICNLLILRS
jgi:E3 ubiquitin-protein ligase HERC2